MKLGDGPSEYGGPRPGDEWREWSAWQRKSVDGIVSFWIPFAPAVVSAAPSSIEILAAQLRASAPGADWNHGGYDRASELAQMLRDRRGVLDASKLTLVRISISRDVIDYRMVQVGSRPGRDVENNDITTPIYAQQEIGRTTELRSGFALSYAGGEPWGFLHAQDAGPELWAREFELEPSEGLTVGVSYVGKGGIRYQIAPSPYGFAIAPNWFSTSDADKIRGIFRLLATVSVSILLPAAGINLAASIGNAVLGSLATQYPAFASALGRVALSSAISGANLEQGIKGAALAFAGGEVGGLVTETLNDATKLELVSKIAGSTTSAALQGGDPRRAAGLALLQNGIASMEIVFTPSGQDNAVISQPTDLPAVQYQPPPMPVIGIPNVTIADQATPSVLPPIAPATLTPPVAATPGIDWRNAQNIVNFASNSAIMVAGAIAAVRNAGNPAVVTAAQVTTPTGQRDTMLDDGYIHRTDVYGRTTQVLPPVGVPHSTVTGNLIVNNGDNTYTMVRADGSRTTTPYRQYTPSSVPGSTGGSLLTDDSGSIQPALLIGGGVLVLALLLMSKGK